MPKKPVVAVVRDSHLHDRLTAMVKPPPVGAVLRDSPLCDRPSLEAILKKRGNDRAYTLISHEADSWVVHFEGDASPTKITSG